MNETLKEKLDIVIITYNRKESLEFTLKQLLDKNSPISQFPITILNNNSTDGTTELINEYCNKFPNLTHICHNRNIGGCANITKVLTEFAKKDYIWGICDNDTYNWDSWTEVENAINNNFDVIVTKNIKDTVADKFYAANFLPSCIYKTKNITDTVIENIYDNIRFLFPHLSVMAKNINNNNKFYIVKKDIVNLGVNPNMTTMYNRGLEEEDIPKSRRLIFWSVGYFNSIELITNRKKQIEIIEGLRHYHKSLFSLFKTIIILNKTLKENYLYNLFQIFRLLDFNQKLKFILAYLQIMLSFKDYKYWFMRYENEWIEYFKSVKEQEYINLLSKKLKNKKVLLYGAGLTADVLFGNYNLSDFNIIGISDKKFETQDIKLYNGLKTIKPNEIDMKEFDVILFTLKEYKKVAKILKTQGINKKIYSIIKTNSKYALRTI